MKYIITALMAFVMVLGLFVVGSVAPNIVDSIPGIATQDASASRGYCGPSNVCKVEYVDSGLYGWYCDTTYREVYQKHDIREEWYYWNAGGYWSWDHGHFSHGPGHRHYTGQYC